MIEKIAFFKKKKTYLKVLLFPLCSFAALKRKRSLNYVNLKERS